MKWKVTFGCCDGTGPYTNEVEAEDLPEFLANLKMTSGIENLNSCVPCGTTEARPGATFDEWWEARGEAGKFKFIAQNIIQWVEDCR